jgi:hypothetical protein
MTTAPRPRLGFALKVAGVLVGFITIGGVFFDLFVPDGATGKSAFGAGTILRTLVLGLLALWLYSKGRGAESPATHGAEAIARRDLRQIADRHGDLVIDVTEPSATYRGSTDEELVEVYGAIDENADRFKELIAEIRRRVSIRSDAS